MAFAVRCVSEHCARPVSQLSTHPCAPPSPNLASPQQQRFEALRKEEAKDNEKLQKVRMDVSRKP